MSDGAKSIDPRELIEQSPLSRLQITAVAVTLGLNALDGFDVLSISFAAPGIATDWGITRDALGVVLSMELIGMALGSVFLGGLADRIGRRPLILGCLIIMAIGMIGAALSGGIAELSAWRLLTGLGIGGVLAAINAMVAEYSNTKSKNICLALMVIGYPLGAVIGGTVAAQLLQTGSWRSVFEFGAIVTALFIPLVWFCLPESVYFLCQKRPSNALGAINRTLAKMGHTPIATMPAPRPNPPKPGLAGLFSAAMAPTTILVTLAYFTHITTFYFILKWVPKIVVDMGFEPSAAAGVLVWANVGGATGGAIFGLLAQRYGLKPLTLIVLLFSSLAVAWFGTGQADLVQLSVICGLGGLFTNSAIVGLYSILARAFPTELRATGTGFAIGVGRGGSALAPILAGVLFAQGFGLQTVALLMASGSLIAFAALTRLRFIG